MMAAYARMARQQLTPELAERLGLSQQVINDLVTEAIVIQGAAHEGVRVSDDELRTTIQQIREFQENGRFSRDEYVKVLRQIRLDPGEFETEVRRQLLRRKMENLIKQGVKVSERGAAAGLPPAPRAGAGRVGLRRRPSPRWPRCRWRTPTSSRT